MLILSFLKCIQSIRATPYALKKFKASILWDKLYNLQPMMFWNPMLEDYFLEMELNWHGWNLWIKYFVGRYSQGKSWWTLGDNWESTVIFFTIYCQFITSAFVFTIGSMFRRAACRNYLLLVRLSCSLEKSFLRPSNSQVVSFPDIQITGI